MDLYLSNYTACLQWYNNIQSRYDIYKQIQHKVHLQFKVTMRRVQNLTRSQAVARIADRTAKNCKGHMT